MEKDKEGDEFRWYKVKAIITVDMEVLAPNRRMAREIAFDEITDEIQSDGVKIHKVSYKIEVDEGDKEDEG